MSETKQNIALYCNRDGKWDRLPVANGCSASTEPLVPDVSNTEEFRRAADFRKRLLQMPIIGIDERLREFGYPRAYVNRMKYHYGLPLPWRIERYYARYNRYRPVRGRIVVRKPTPRHKPIVWKAADYRFLKKYGL